MKSKIIILIVTILIFCVCKLNSQQSDNNYLKISDIDSNKSFEGYIKSHPLNKLSFGADGRIIYMPHKKGDYVKKGEIIARLDGLL